MHNDRGVALALGAKISMLAGGHGLIWVSVPICTWIELVEDGELTARASCGADKA